MLLLSEKTEKSTNVFSTKLQVEVSYIAVLKDPLASSVGLVTTWLPLS